MTRQATADVEFHWQGYILQRENKWLFIGMVEDGHLQLDGEVAVFFVDGNCEDELGVFGWQPGNQNNSFKRAPSDLLQQKGKIYTKDGMHVPDVEQYLLDNQDAIFFVSQAGFLVTLYGSKPSSMRIKCTCGVPGHVPQLSFRAHQLKIKEALCYDLSFYGDNLSQDQRVQCCEVALNMKLSNWIPNNDPNDDTLKIEKVTAANPAADILLPFVRQKDPHKRIAATDLHVIYNPYLWDMFKAQHRFFRACEVDATISLGFVGLKDRDALKVAEEIAGKGFDLGCYNEGANLYGAGGAYLTDSINYIIQSGFVSNFGDKVIMIVLYMTGNYQDGLQANKQPMAPNQHSWITSLSQLPKFKEDGYQIVCTRTQNIYPIGFLHF